MEFPGEKPQNAPRWRTPRPAGWFVGALALGLVVFAGWIWSLPPLKTVLPGFISMKANTALGLSLFAAAGLLLSPKSPSRPRRIAGSALAGIAGLLGLLTLLEYLLGVSFGIDELLFHDPDAAGTPWPPGRFAPVTAVNFTMLGLACLLDLARSESGRKLRQALLLIVWVVSFQAFIGYLAGVTYSFGSAFYTQIAIHTAVAFILLCVGFLLSRPDEGIMATLLGASVAGQSGRRLLATAILIPPLTNWFQLQGVKAGYWDADFGVLLRVVGNVVFFSWVALQTSSRLAASEREQAEAHADLKRAVRARDELLSICSHELRTPITSMKLTTQIIQRRISQGGADELSPEKMRRVIDQSERQLDRLTRLIEEMLDFSRINAGKLALNPERCNLSELVADVIDRLQPQIQSAGCKVTAALDERAVAILDPHRIEQVVTNLLTNALKFAAGKPIAVSVASGPGCLRLSVQDDGMGIEPENQARIFEPYERAVSVTNISGLGLGLYITRRIVEDHGGRIWVESAPLKGSTFWVELPGSAASA